MTHSKPDPQAAPDLRVAVMRLARRLRTERAVDGMTLSQVAILGTLYREGPKTPTELADIERVRPPSMSRQLQALLAQGLITKQAHESDRRQVLVALTDKAREWIAADRQRRDRWLSQRLELLSPHEQQQLMAAVPLLHRIAQED
jgi:DNA-binding MarR family transcriptional regulator